MAEYRLPSGIHCCGRWGGRGRSLMIGDKFIDTEHHLLLWGKRSPNWRTQTLFNQKSI